MSFIKETQIPALSARVQNTSTAILDVPEKSLSDKIVIIGNGIDLPPENNIPDAFEEFCFKTVVSLEREKPGTILIGPNAIYAMFNNISSVRLPDAIAIETNSLMNGNEKKGKLTGMFEFKWLDVASLEERDASISEKLIGFSKLLKKLRGEKNLPDLLKNTCR
jgi:hypothetical protein